MARRVLALILLGLALIVCVVLAASESLTNRTGKTATAVTITFSEEVRVTSYDEAVFPTKEPSSRASTFKFSGGQLENGGRFSVSWSPSGATIESYEWVTEPDPSGPVEVGAVWDQRRVDRINQVLGEVSKLAVMGTKVYYFAAEGKGGLTAEDVMEAFYDLTIFTLGLEEFTATAQEPATGRGETIVGGESGRAIRQAFFYCTDTPDPSLANAIGVINRGPATSPASPGDEVFEYGIGINKRIVRVYLSPTRARTDGGCAVGIYYLIGQKYLDMTTEPSTLLIHQMPIHRPSEGILEQFPNIGGDSWVGELCEFTCLDDDELTILQWQGWLIAEGNPMLIGHRPLGPP